VSDNHARLAGAVRRDFQERRHHRGRCDVDDAPVAARQHGAPEDLTGAQRPGQVGVDDGVPVVLGEVDGRHALGAAGAVDQDVDLAEPAQHLITQAFERRAIGDVGAGAQRAAP